MREAFVAALDEVSIIRISGIVQRRGAKENCGQRISRHILDPLPADVNWGKQIHSANNLGNPQTGWRDELEIALSVGRKHDARDILGGEGNLEPRSESSVRSFKET